MLDISSISEQANILYEEGKYIEALSLYYKVLSENLNNSICNCNVAIVYEILGEFELAVAFYKRAIRLDEKNVRALNNLARIYVDIIKDYEIAKEYLDYAIQTAPNDPEAYNTYGTLSFKQEDFKLAENYFKKSIFLDEGFFKNYYDIAQVYMSLEKTENAKEALEKCLSLNPQFTPAKKLIEKIEN